MKRKFFYLILSFLFILIFINYKVISSAALCGLELFIKKIFPTLFIMIILNDLLLSSNIINLFKNKYNYIFFISFLCGSPTNYYIINDLYKNNIIDKKFANYYLLTSFFCNPLFLYTILNTIFTKKITIKLLFIHYLTKIIINLVFSKNLISKNNNNNSKSNINLSLSIKKAVNINLMVMGTIVFYSIISSILLNTFNMSKNLEILFKGIIEITQGLNCLNNLEQKKKEIYALLFISFGGISIHSQIKSILNNTNLNYKYFLLGRIFETILSFIILSCWQ